jgi:hypothetical protein
VDEFVARIRIEFRHCGRYPGVRECIEIHDRGVGLGAEEMAHEIRADEASTTSHQEGS